MECRDCGNELPKGAYYCGGCGNPVGFSPQTSILTESDGLDAVPAPAAPVEQASSAPPAPTGASRRADRALCSLCMGAFPESVLSRIDGCAYCPDCSPLSARRSEPEPRPAAVPEPTGAPGLAPARPLLYREEASGGGAKKALAVVLVLLLLGAGGFAAYSFLGQSRIDKLMVGMDTGKRPGKLLYQKYEAGETLDYGIKGRIDGRMDVPGMGMMMGGSNEIVMDMAMNAAIAIRVLNVDSRGNAELDVAFTDANLSGSVQAGGNSIPLNDIGGGVLGALQGERMRVTVDPFGRTLEADTGAGGGSLEKMMSGRFGAMPDRHLVVGDEWTDTEVLDMSAGGAPGLGGPLAISATYRVEGYKRVRGHDCMVISIVGEMGGNGLPQFPGISDMSLDVDLEGVVFFDLDAGQMEKMAMDLSFDFSADGPGGSMTMEMKIELDLDRQ